MQYRSEIDGLRSIAVIPVVLFHSGLVIFSGGYVGVDIFFVISGYLISDLVIIEIEEGRFSIFRFFERRIRRIVPALFFVMFCTIPFAWVWMVQKPFQEFGLSIGAASLSISNVLFSQRSGYFDLGSEIQPMLHTWSLAVEEQFYILFPLLLMIIWRFGWWMVFITISIILVISLALADFSSQRWPATAFFLPHTRIWELLFGVLCTLYERKNNIRSSNAISLTGVFLIFISLFYFDENTPTPSFWTLIPVFGTGLILLFGREETIFKKIFSMPIFVSIGLVSYSAYLWHQPLFVFARIRLLDDPSASVMVALCGTTFILAWVTWKFIETPFRNRIHPLLGRQGMIFAGCAIGVVAFTSFGLIAEFSGGIPSRLPPEVVALASWSHRNESVRQCSSPADRTSLPLGYCIYGDLGKADTAILGDSHAMAISSQLASALEGTGHGLSRMTLPGCPPILGLHLMGRGNRCHEFNNSVYEYIAENDYIKTVVLFARWSHYTEGTPYNNGEGGEDKRGDGYAIPINAPFSFIRDPNRIAVVGALYRESIEKLIESGKKVVLVYGIPEPGWDVPVILAKKALFGIEGDSPLSISFDSFDMRSKRTVAEFDRLDESSSLVRIKPDKFLCNTIMQGRCVLQLNDMPLYSDDNHPNSVGANIISAAIVDSISAKGWLPINGTDRRP